MRVPGGGVTVFNMGVKVGLFDKVSFEQRIEGKGSGSSLYLGKEYDS